MASSHPHFSTYTPSKNTPITILKQHPSLDTSEQLHSQHRKDNMQSLHKFTLDPSEYNTKLNLQINNNTLDMVTNPKILGLTLDPKLAYHQHIDNTALKHPRHYLYS